MKPCSSTSMTVTPSSTWLVLAASMLTLATWTTVCDAHPKHEAIAEVAWNRSTGKLEVAMRFRPEDLEAALTRILRSKQVNLDTTPKVDEHLANYMRARFYVSGDNAETRHRLKWIGKEVDLRYAWVYFELALPQDAVSISLTCTPLMDLLPDQVNTIILQDGKSQRSLQFTRFQPRQELSTPTAERAIDPAAGP